MNRIIVCSKQELSTLPYGENAALILINDPYMGRESTDLKSYSQVLELAFHNIDPEGLRSIDLAGHVVFNPSHAREILEFSERVNKDPSVTDLIVASKHGRSRSVSIGKVLSAIYGVRLESRKTLLFGNEYVKNVLVAECRKTRTISATEKHETLEPTALVDER